MSTKKLCWSAALAGASLVLATAPQAAQAQTRKVSPERSLLGIKLGSQFGVVLARYGHPDEIQTVAVANSTESLPQLGGGAAGAGMTGGGMSGMSGAPFAGGGGGGAMGGNPYSGGGMAAMRSSMMGGAGRGGMMGGMGSAGMAGMAGGGGAMGGNPYSGGGMAAMRSSMMGGAGMAGGGGGKMGAMGMGGGMPPYGGGSMFGGSMGGSGLPPVGGGGDAMGGTPAAESQNLPEYSTAILWVYKNKDGGRKEFLMNEDGKVAQISAAAPAGKGITGATTARGVSLGTGEYKKVLAKYGFPERTRLLPGLRFNEAYYTRDFHTAFTFDTTKGLKVVRITIALAD